MMSALTLPAALAIALAVHGIWRARASLTHTTLLSAWRWAVAAGLVWTAAWVTTVAGATPAPLLDVLWYSAAVLAICPAVAVLGARRPGSGVWTAFVVLPLLAVLGWPLLTTWRGVGDWQVLRLETPHLLGVALILLMGAGNYIGTRFGLSAAVYILSVCLLLSTMSAVSPPALEGSITARQLASVGLGLSISLARLMRTSRSELPPGFDRLWTDYRDAFGIVWARRFQDRLNGIAAQQRWPARLGDGGIEWIDADATNRPEVRDRIDQTFRWLLRRFVDPEWIDLRSTPEQIAASECAPP